MCAAVEAGGYDKHIAMSFAAVFSEPGFVFRELIRNKAPRTPLPRDPCVLKHQRFNHHSLVCDLYNRQCHAYDDMGSSIIWQYMHMCGIIKQQHQASCGMKHDE